MKSTTKTFMIFVFAVILSMSLILVACTGNQGSFIITANTTTVSADKPVTINIPNYTSDKYELTVSDSTLVAIENGVLKVIGNVTQNTTVTVTATLLSDPSVTATKTFTVIASKAQQTIAVQAGVEEAQLGAKIRFLVTVSDGGEYVLTADSDVLSFNGNEAVVVKDVQQATVVTVTATSKTDANVKSTCTLTIKPKTQIATKITIKPDSYEVTDKAAVNVAISVNTGEDYTVTLSKTDAVLAFRNGVLSIVDPVDKDQNVVMTVTTVGENPVTETATFVIKAKTPQIGITMLVDKNEIGEGEQATFTVNVLNSVNTGYKLEIVSSNAAVVSLENNVMTVNADKIVTDTYVTVKATAEADKAVYKTISIFVRAPRKAGSVTGLNGIVLNQDKISAIGNSNITVSGILEDHYEDLVNETDDYNSYDMTVKMSDGAWNGSWNAKLSEKELEDLGIDAADYKPIVATDVYRRGEVSGKKLGSQDLHYYVQKYVGLDNKVANKVVKDYRSQPLYWENQHLWNHLGSIDVNKLNSVVDSEFVTKYGYDSTKYAAFKYTYSITAANEEEDPELLFLTYLAFSLTPMLSDTLMNVYVICDANGVVGLVGQTYVNITYQASESATATPTPIARDYTIVNVKFSDVGTTVVEDPAPYTIDKSDVFEEQAYTALETALADIKGLTNYTFKAVDTTTRQPQASESDYTNSGTGSSTSQTALLAGSGSFGRDERSETGTVGTVGYVTEEGIVMAVTTKYQQYDSNPYHTKYNGYKQMQTGENAYYERFNYSYDNAALTGVQRLPGLLTSIIPQFNLAPEIFEWVGSSKDPVTGKMLATFELRDANATKEAAKQVSMYNYVSSAESSITRKMTVTVTLDGKLYQTEYPYGINDGTYQGYVTTTYTKLGTTTLPEGAFDNYVPRVISENWKDFTIPDYYYLHTSRCEAYGCKQPDGTYDHSAHTKTADYVLQAIYGEEWTKIPTYKDFSDIFTDNVFGPWYNELEKAGGEYAPIMKLTARSEEKDENSRLTEEQYNAFYKAFDDLFITKYGFSKSKNNTDTSGGESGLSDIDITYINGSVMARINNNHTANFFITFYRTGDWKLK